jgi:hypothetical protein
MDTFVVNATSLNLRSSPLATANNVIAALPHGQQAEVLDQSNAEWWKVRAQLAGHSLTGYAASRFLQREAEAPALPAHTAIAPVHYPKDARARRSSTEARFSPLDETLPTRDANAPPADKVAAIHRIIQALDVQHSARYLPTAHSTFCNIYAYDLCYLANAYLPRVWWSSKALLQLAQGQAVRVAYGTTVYEQSANGLYDWLTEWGPDLGWTRSFDLTELQNRVNEGRIGIVCAKRRDLSRSGHITCVIPETPAHVAERVGPSVTAPLQSQAGSKNKQYFRNTWWVERASEYSESGLFCHD